MCTVENKVKVSVKTQKLGHILTGRDLADQKPQLIQRASSKSKQLGDGRLTDID